MTTTGRIPSDATVTVAELSNRPAVDDILKADLLVGVLMGLDRVKAAVVLSLAIGYRMDGVVEDFYRFGLPEGDEDAEALAALVTVDTEGGD